MFELMDKPFTLISLLRNRFMYLNKILYAVNMHDREDRHIGFSHVLVVFTPPNSHKC